MDSIAPNEAGQSARELIRDIQRQRDSLNERVEDIEDQQEKEIEALKLRHRTALAPLREDLNLLNNALEGIFRFSNAFKADSGEISHSEKAVEGETLPDSNQVEKSLSIHSLITEYKGPKAPKKSFRDMTLEAIKVVDMPITNKEITDYILSRYDVGNNEIIQIRTSIKDNRRAPKGNRKNPLIYSYAVFQGVNRLSLNCLPEFFTENEEKDIAKKILHPEYKAKLEARFDELDLSWNPKVV